MLSATNIGSSTACMANKSRSAQRVGNITQEGGATDNVVLLPWENKQDRRSFVPLSESEIASMGPRVICISGPSGIGKDEALDQFFDFQSSEEVINARCNRLSLVTTRGPRCDEIKGEKRISTGFGPYLDKSRYFFAEEDDFQGMVDLSMMVAWRKRETGNYYGLAYPMLQAALEQPNSIALISCGLRLGWIIKQCLGGYPTLIYATSSDKKVREFYRESGRSQEEEKIRLKLRFYKKWAPVLADYFFDSDDYKRGDLVGILANVVEIIKRRNQ